MSDYEKPSYHPEALTDERRALLQGMNESLMKSIKSVKSALFTYTVALETIYRMANEADHTAIPIVWTEGEDPNLTRARVATNHAAASTILNDVEEAAGSVYKAVDKLEEAVSDYTSASANIVWEYRQGLIRRAEEVTGITDFEVDPGISFDEMKEMNAEFYKAVTPEERETIPDPEGLLTIDEMAEMKRAYLDMELAINLALQDMLDNPSEFEGYDGPKISMGPASTYDA